MNRYCHTKTANRGFKRRSSGRGGNAKVAATSRTDKSKGQRRTRRKTKPEASSSRKARNKTLGVGHSRFSVERSLKHSGLFWLDIRTATDGRHNISALQIEFHWFASLLETTNPAAKKSLTHQNGCSQTWSDDGTDNDGLCGRGLDHSAASSWGHSLHGAELHDESSVSGGRRVPMHLRMGGGRLRKHPLHQGSGRMVRRQAHEVRDLRRGIDVLQLQPLLRLLDEDIPVLRRQTLHLVEGDRRKKMSLLGATFSRLIIMEFFFPPKSDTYKRQAQ